MSNLLSIDPGVNGCGVAVFSGESNHLLWAGYVKNSGTGVRNMVDAVDTKLCKILEPPYTETWPNKLAIELPQVYLASRSRGDPNDLIQLALVVGGFEMWFDGLVFKLLPHQWKGTVPKEIMAARILKRLSEEEQSKIEKAPKSLLHNTLDSVGLGLWHLKRL